MLQFGAVKVDLLNNKVYGDVKHCPLEDLVESAIALTEIIPKGVTAVLKDYAGDCYYYAPKRFAKLHISAQITLKVWQNYTANTGTGLYGKALGTRRNAYIRDVATHYTKHQETGTGFSLRGERRCKPSYL